MIIKEYGDVNNMEAKMTKPHSSEIIKVQLHGPSEEEYIREVKRNIKNNINKLIYNSSLTIKQFVVKAGISHSTLARIINGQENIKLTTLCKIGANFGIPIQNIITSGNDNQKNPRDEG